MFAEKQVRMVLALFPPTRVGTRKVVEPPDLEAPPTAGSAKPKAVLVTAAELEAEPSRVLHRPTAAVARRAARRRREDHLFRRAHQGRGRLSSLQAQRSTARAFRVSNGLALVVSVVLCALCARLLALDSRGSGVRACFGPSFGVGAVGGLACGTFVLLATGAGQLGMYAYTESCATSQDSVYTESWYTESWDVAHRVLVCARLAVTSHVASLGIGAAVLLALSATLLLLPRPATTTTVAVLARSFPHRFLDAAAALGLCHDIEEGECGGAAIEPLAAAADLWRLSLAGAAGGAALLLLPAARHAAQLLTIYELARELYTCRGYTCCGCTRCGYICCGYMLIVMSTH